MSLKKCSLAISLLIWFSCWASAEEPKTMQLSAERIKQAMERFVRAPHPMASPEQKKLTQEIKQGLQKDAWDVQVQKFSVTVPNTNHERLGGNDKKADPTKAVEGENIVAISKGSERCMLLIGGHYDTKFFRNAKFVGANDGGSSTVAMQELAHVISQIKKQDKAKSGNGRWLDCSIGLVFFDGEEAYLPEWSDGERLLGLQDNIYGSRAFAAKLEKKFEGITYQGLPIKAAIIIDMIGHKNQNLFISKGSHPQLSQTLLAQKTSTIISASNGPMDDDHIPFAQLGIPFLHIIDWTNLAEWHTPQDTTAIISNQKIAEFGDMLLRFLKQKR
ncbi:MAG: M28 family peptidase [Undibacterium sp.]|nr:M28 family peptidase [Undibacterium sp.]